MRELDTRPVRSDAVLPCSDAPRVVVLLARIDRASIGALAYARSIAPIVTAVHVTDDAADADRLRSEWRRLELNGNGDLVILQSPDDAVVPTVMAYVETLQEREPERRIVVVLSELVPRRPWAHLLHEQTALRLKLRLFFRPNTVVIDVPYHL